LCSYTAVLYQLTESIALALSDAGIDTAPWPASAPHAALALSSDPASAAWLGSAGLSSDGAGAA
jgi:hypothetical protein